MDKIKIYGGKLEGTVKIPPSKSIAHRSVICASLTKGISRISNIELSDDILATIEGMKKLGAKIEIDGDNLIIEGIFKREISDEDIEIDCNESGSTLRFLVPVGLLSKRKINYRGRGNLGKRPLDIYYDIFDKQGIEYSYKKDILDLSICGEIKSDTFYIRGDVSSQFITGLLFTLPLLEGDSKIIITNKLESKGYIDLTLQCLEKFGIKIENKNYKEFVIKGSQEYKEQDFQVEGDYSQSAFFLTANCLGGDIKLSSLEEYSLQGDKEILEILKKIGVKFRFTQKGLELENRKELKGIEVDASDCPDIIPIVSLALALSRGESKVINCQRLRIKECDRLEATCQELNKLGANLTIIGDELRIKGVEKLVGGTKVWSHKDHRIAMTLAIAGAICENPITIVDYQCVSKSYPNFFEDLEKLGCKFEKF